MRKNYQRKARKSNHKFSLSDLRTHRDLRLAVRLMCLGSRNQLRIRFQSFFMLMTSHPLAVASS